MKPNDTMKLKHALVSCVYCITSVTFIVLFLSSQAVGLAP